jgi:hypothetical protein
MRLSLAVVSLPLVLLVAACQSGDVKVKVPISGGGEIAVPLTREGPPPGQADGYKVDVATLQPAQENREAFYKFGLVANHEPALRRIRIEDISDEKAALLADVTDPKFTDRHWTVETETMTTDDPRLQWVFQITMSMRVYRFTLTRTDGTDVSFNHIAVYPPFFKALIRSKWGEKY